MQVTFKVRDMMCSHCRAAILDALRARKGVQGVDVDLGNKTVTVSYRPAEVTIGDLKRSILEAGYTAED